MFTCGHILHWYFLMAWWGCWWSAPLPDILATLIGWGTIRGAEVGGEEEAADSGRAPGE